MKIPTMLRLLSILALAATLLQVVVLPSPALAQTRTFADLAETFIRLVESGPVTKVELNSPDRKVEFRLAGRMAINPDEDDIVLVTNRATLTEIRGGVTRRVEFRLTDRHIVRRYTVDGRESTYDADAQAWFSGLMRTVLREGPLLAETRVDRLLRKGGPKAVVDEIAQIQSPNARKIYANELSRRGAVPPEQMERLNALLDGK